MNSSVRTYKVNRIDSQKRLINAVFSGRSGETRTRGFDIPNVAPYHLGYTPKLFICGHNCGQTGCFMKIKARKSSVFKPIFDTFAVRKPRKVILLPKQARYQLRYTPKFL